MKKSLEHRTYLKQDCVTFRKTTEEFGGFSNMAGGYPLLVNNVRILTSEALYQACRFPHLPDVQRLIISQKSPMTAKMKSKPYRKDSRADWDTVRIRIMRWCLRVKLAQNWDKFSKLLLSTGSQSIVEDSRRDDFWGAKTVDEKTLVGTNALGRLLMELREQLCGNEIDSLQVVVPPSLPNFLLLGKDIKMIQESSYTQVPQYSHKEQVKQTLVNQLPSTTNPNNLIEDSIRQLTIPGFEV